MHQDARVQFYKLLSQHVSAKEDPNMKEPVTPQGTIALMLVYVVIIVALWTNVYMTMISRGVTQ